MSAPQIFNFLNIQQYLQEVYTYRKGSEVKFSYQLWAQEVGIKDRSYLRQIVNGKRKINEKLVTQLTNKMQLTTDEQKYFALLVQYSSSPKEVQDKIGMQLVEIIKNSSN